MSLEARQLTLPTSLRAVSPHISSLLYDPLSSSLALRHSDSSFALYPSFSPFSLRSFPAPKSLVPSPTSSAAFLHVRTVSSPTITTLFVTTAPLLRPSPSTLLRFYVLRDGRFVKIRVISGNRDLEADRTKSGVVFKVNHGVSVRLSAGINVFSLYSVSNSKIWLFAARLVADDGGGEALKLMKCAVIDCCSPVFTIRILFGFMVLGEENGVRFFPLQRLVKGNHKKEKKNVGKRSNLRNGMTNGTDVAMASSGSKAVGTDGDSTQLTLKGEKSEKHYESGNKEMKICQDVIVLMLVQVKSRYVKLRQDSKDVGAFFVAFKDKDGESSISTMSTGRSVKTVSIKALSANYFVVLDSDGDVHLLCLSHFVQGFDNPCTVKRLTQTMKVVELAVFHDISTDGSHSVHLMATSDIDTSFDKTDSKESKEKLLQTTVTQMIFASEKIRDVVPLAANSILILGQGSIFAYAIS